MGGGNQIKTGRPRRQRKSPTVHQGAGARGGGPTSKGRPGGHKNQDAGCERRKAEDPTVYQGPQPEHADTPNNFILLILSLNPMSGDAGCWKTKDNQIIEILPNNERRVRFVPTSAKNTPKAMQVLCEAYRRVRRNEQIPALIAVATSVFDLLCIHPFRDGNGRVSRLVTTFLLIQEGFTVCRYISLERIVEQRKEEYYQVLEQCSKGWHQGRNDIIAWWNFFLSMLRSAYDELAQKVEGAALTAPKGDMVRRVINAQVGPFTLSEIAAQVPEVSLGLVKRILATMKKEGALAVAGRGRGAVWEMRRKS